MSVSESPVLGGDGTKDSLSCDMTRGDAPGTWKHLVLSGEMGGDPGSRTDRTRLSVIKLAPAMLLLISIESCSAHVSPEHLL